MSNTSIPGLHEFPKLKISKTFEHLVKDCLEEKYNMPFYLYGRAGQTQDGIDLYSDDWKYIVQCKNYLTENEKEFRGEIKKDYRAACIKFSNADFFIVATSLNRDKHISDFIEGLEDKINIRILFWQDFEEIIDSDPKLISTYYPNYIVDKTSLSSEKPNLDSPVYWISIRQRENDFWFDDRHPFLLSNLLLSTAGRGIFFLVSNWFGAIGDTLNQLSEKQGLALHWSDVRIDQYDSYIPEDGCVVLTIRNKQESMFNVIKRCVEDWKDVDCSYQLVFNYCFDNWLDALLSAGHTVKDLYSIFPGIHIDLLSVLNPFLDTDIKEEDHQQTKQFATELFEYISSSGEDNVYHLALERVLEQVHQQPNQCIPLLQLGKRFKKLYPLTFCFASYAVSSCRLFMEDLEPEQLSGLINDVLEAGISPNWDICAWEICRRCCLGQDVWMPYLELICEYCSDSMRSLIGRNFSDLFLCEEVQTPLYIIQDTPKTLVLKLLESHNSNSLKCMAVLLCSKYSMDFLGKKLQDKRLARQYRSALVPKSFGIEDETIATIQHYLRPAT